MTDGEKMLEEIRRNLEESGGQNYSLPEPEESASKNDLMELFTKQLSAVDGEPFVVDGRKELLEEIRHYLRKREIEDEIQLFEDELIKKLKIFPGLKDVENIVKKEESNVSSLFEAQASITGVDYLLAETGSCVISSELPGGRYGSLIPPYHIAVAEKSSILPDFKALCNTDIFDSLTVNLISGPSRTADIEKNLVLGMHGPVRLAVFIVR